MFSLLFGGALQKSSHEICRTLDYSLQGPRLIREAWANDNGAIYVRDRDIVNFIRIGWQTAVAITRRGRWTENATETSTSRAP